MTISNHGRKTSFLKSYFRAKLSIIPTLFQPLFHSIFSTIPWTQRWRVFLLQPINLLTALLTSPYWTFNNRYSIIYIPTRSGTRRCLIYLPPDHQAPESSSQIQPPNIEQLTMINKKQYPLHLDIHGGGFIGGFPEANARFCSLLSSTTNTVVISASYHTAPKHTFPAAHDDIDDIVTWLLHNAASHWNVDLNLFTMGGSSAGCNLALSTATTLHTRTCKDPAPPQGTFIPEVKGFVGFYAPIDLRLKPEEKPRPAKFPKRDPFSFLLPLYDAYAGPSRKENMRNPRLHPIIAEKNTLPKDILFIVPEIDILVHEQLTFVERLKREIEEAGEESERKVEARVVEKAFHGWIECECFFCDVYLFRVLLML